jgi:CBS domain-containing protein
MSTMSVANLIGDDVIYVAPDADLVAVADVLTANDIGIVVVGEPGDVRGVISERDLVHALARRLVPDSTRAMDIARTELVWCDASATIAQVATEMMGRYVRHALVEADGRLAGIVSARDLLGAYVATDEESAV